MFGVYDVVETKDDNERMSECTSERESKKVNETCVYEYAERSVCSSGRRYFQAKKREHAIVYLCRAEQQITSTFYIIV